MMHDFDPCFDQGTTSIGTTCPGVERAPGVRPFAAIAFAELAVAISGTDVTPGPDPIDVREVAVVVWLYSHRPRDPDILDVTGVSASHSRP
jgi:hypothetical protein